MDIKKVKLGMRVKSTTGWTTFQGTGVVMVIQPRQNIYGDTYGTHRDGILVKPDKPCETTLHIIPGTVWVNAKYIEPV